MARRRRWLQFSIVSLLVAMSLVAVVARFLLPTALQRRAVAELENLGATVFFDYDAAAGNEPPGPPWLRRLIGDDYFRRVTGVDLPPGQFPDSCQAR